ncbi:MAG: DUF4114 domain-containing protein, partial [Synechocystis sp.]|nr:DUF4114 domain-containing protein [Synechocystis sp.]
SEAMAEIRLDKEITAPSVVEVMGTFADIPGGLRGEPVLYTKLADGTNQYIYLDKNTGAESVIAVSHQGSDISNDVTQFIPVDSQDSLGKLEYNLDSVANRTTTQTNQDALNQTDALFDNIVGLYRVANSDGAVFDIFDANGNGATTDLLNPGESGYANAALNQVASNVLLQLGSLGDVSKNTTANEFGDVLVNGGQAYAPFVVANGGSFVPQGGTLQDGLTAFLAQNPANTGANIDNFLTHAVAYFGFGSANPDSSEHLKSYGNNTFGFEDLPGNLGVSDFDFNDGVFQFTFLS